MPSQVGQRKRSGVVGERPGFQPLLLGVRQGGEGAAQIVQHAGVCAHGGAHVHADGRGVHQIDPRDARSVHGQHMPVAAACRPVMPSAPRQAFQHESRLAPEPDTPVTQVRRPFGRASKRMHGVDGVGLQCDGPSSKRCRRGATGVHRTFAVPAKTARCGWPGSPPSRPPTLGR